MSHYGSSAGTIDSKTRTIDMTSVTSTGRHNVSGRSFIDDPFASSAPAVSLFGQQLGEQSLWGQSSRSHRDTIGLHSSPRKSFDFLGNSPHLNNGSFFNGCLSIPKQNDHVYDLDDAMLPSSLNDLFSPIEIHSTRSRHQEYKSNDWIPDSQQQWKIPFLTKNNYMSFDDSSASTVAINILGGNNNHETPLNSYSQQDDLNIPQIDDEVQFFMEDDEIISNDHRTLNMAAQPSQY